MTTKADIDTSWPYPVSRKGTILPGQGRSVNTMVWVSTSFVAKHKHPTDIKKWAFFKNEHSHSFQVKVWLKSTDPLQKEVFRLKLLVDAIAKHDMSYMSCEYIADEFFAEIALEFPETDIWVEVSEEGSVGVLKQWDIT